MKLERAGQDPSEAIDFYEQALTALGALCERTWHDRLNVVAEGTAARLWNPEGALHEIELRFAPEEATSARDADREVFAGCPLSFRLSEALRPAPLVLERYFLSEGAPLRAPDLAVAEKLWRTQFPETKSWRLGGPLTADFHFSLLASARCEIQAIDQRWTMHRVAVSLADGSSDDDLAGKIGFQNSRETTTGLIWPAVDAARCQALLASAMELELETELASIRGRQEASLRRELERIDDYFENYERELAERAARSRVEASKLKVADRLAAAKAEHERRRADQLARHEIRVIPHLDSVLLVAEKCWHARVELDAARRSEPREALFLPRSRRWKLPGPA